MSSNSCMCYMPSCTLYLNYYINFKKNERDIDEITLFHTFLTLPFEVQLVKFYDLYLNINVTIQIPSSMEINFKSRLTNLFHFCSQFHDECNLTLWTSLCCRSIWLKIDPRAKISCPSDAWFEHVLNEW